MATRSKLAVILHADIVGSTKLVQLDERIAHDRIQDAFRRFADVIAAYGGMTHELRGDALVAEFERGSDAISAALAFQAANVEHNENLEDEIHAASRVGIALGDVVVADQTLTGVGVVLAQRLEQLAAPGGVIVQGAIYEATPRRMPFIYEDLGETDLKGFPEPIRAFRVTIAPDAVVPAPESGTGSASLLAPQTVPTKPSVAVLPFANLSSDPEQDYFADGMTEDIITGLSRFRSLFVIARNSSFAYKGRSPDVREVARDLGVRYVLEGSVRRVGDRIRITGQLVDAETGNHLWAERYDRELEDIFAVQDEVTEAIVAAIAPEIGEVERERARRKPPNNLDAWGLYQRGLAAYYSSTEEGLRLAIEQFDRVTEIDPRFAPSFAMAAGARIRYLMHFNVDNPREFLNQAREKVYKAITLDSRDPIGLWNAGRVHSMLGHHDVAISKVEEAIALNPNDAMSHQSLGLVLTQAGRSKEAVAHFDHAMRLSPRDIFLPGFLSYRAVALFDLERYDEAFECARRARLSPSPRSVSFAMVAAALTKLGRHEEAKNAIDELLAHAPGMSLGLLRERPWLGTSEAMVRLLDSLREAGLPE